jgi:hypothetical protein
MLVAKWRVAREERFLSAQAGRSLGNEREEKVGLLRSE